MRILIIALCFLWAAPVSYAQKPAFQFFKRLITPVSFSPKVSKILTEGAGKQAAEMAVGKGVVRAAELEKAVSQQARNTGFSQLGLKLPPQIPVTSLTQVERHIHQSVVEVFRSGMADFMGSGFVVRSSSGKLYAVASYHVVGRAGNKVDLHMYDKDGKMVVYKDLAVARAGAYGINSVDAAIIALPQEAQNHTRPLEVAPFSPNAGNMLVVWGRSYFETKISKRDQLQVRLAQDMKIVMNRPGVSEKFNGLCGSPLLNEQGKVVGIYSGHNPNTRLVYAVNAQKALDILIGSYEKGEDLPITNFKVFGKTELQLRIDESIGWITHFDRYGSLLNKVYLPKYAGPFDPEHIEQLFGDLRPGDVLEFEVVKHRLTERIVPVDIF